MKLSEILLQRGVSSLQKSLSVSPLPSPPLITSFSRSDFTNVFPCNSKAVPPTTSSCLKTCGPPPVHLETTLAEDYSSCGKRASGSHCLRYVVNPARHSQKRPPLQFPHGSHHFKDTSQALKLHSDLAMLMHMGSEETCSVPILITHGAGRESYRRAYIDGITSSSMDGWSHIMDCAPQDHYHDVVKTTQRTATPTPSSPLPPQQQQGNTDLPTPAQLSVILLKLREELPDFFSGHHTYAMYASDVVFVNNLLPFSWTLHSRWSYRCFLASSRLLLRTAYSRLNLDLLRITKDVDTGKIEARWRLRGKPRTRFSEKVILDGYSEFCVNCSGLISRHHMDCMMPSKKRVRGKIRTFMGSSPLTVTQTNSS